MRIRVAFTVEVNASDLDALRELAGGVEDLAEVRAFVKMDAEQYVVDYLTDNGVRAAIRPTE